MGDDTIRIAHRALSFIIYVPLVALGLFACSKLYDFIYKPLGENTSFNLLKQQAKSWWEAWIVSIVGGIGNLIGFLKPVKNIIRDNLFRGGVLSLLALYFAMSYYMVYFYEAGAVIENYSTLVNIILVLLGAFFSVYVLSLFTGKGDKAPEKWAEISRKPVAKKLRWTWERSVPIYKYILGISITLGLLMFILYLISQFTMVSVTMAVVIQIIAIIGLLFGIFLYVSRNREWMARIKKAPLYNLLYYFAFRHTLYYPMPY